MKSLWKSAAWVGLSVGIGCIPSQAQMKNNTEKQMTCEQNRGDEARHCDIREQIVPSAWAASWKL